MEDTNPLIACPLEQARIFHGLSGAVAASGFQYKPMGQGRIRLPYLGRGTDDIRRC